MGRMWRREKLDGMCVERRKKRCDKYAVEERKTWRWNGKDVEEEKMDGPAMGMDVGWKDRDVWNGSGVDERIACLKGER